MREKVLPSVTQHLVKEIVSPNQTIRQQVSSCVFYTYTSSNRFDLAVTRAYPGSISRGERKNCYPSLSLQGDYLCTSPPLPPSQQFVEFLEKFLMSIYPPGSKQVQERQRMKELCKSEWTRNTCFYKINGHFFIHRLNILFLCLPRFTKQPFTISCFPTKE